MRDLEITKKTTVIYIVRPVRPVYYIMFFLIVPLYMLMVFALFSIPLHIYQKAGMYGSFFLALSFVILFVSISLLVHQLLVFTALRGFRYEFLLEKLKDGRLRYQSRGLFFNRVSPVMSENLRITIKPVRHLLKKKSTGFSIFIENDRSGLGITGNHPREKFSRRESLYSFLKDTRDDLFIPPLIWYRNRHEAEKASAKLVEEIEAFLHSHPMNGKEVKPHMMSSHISDDPARENQEELVERLFGAVKAGNLNVVRRLIDTDVDVNSRDYLMRTPLHYARNPEIIDLLVQKGGRCDVVDLEGRTPLMQYNLPSDSIETFVINGVDVNAFDSSGATALFYVLLPEEEIGWTLQGVESIQKLVCLGADIHHRNNLGQTVFDVIEQRLDSGGEIEDIEKLRIALGNSERNIKNG